MSMDDEGDVDMGAEWVLVSIDDGSIQTAFADHACNTYVGDHWRRRGSPLIERVGFDREVWRVGGMMPDTMGLPLHSRYLFWRVATWHVAGKRLIFWRPSASSTLTHLVVTIPTPSLSATDFSGLRFIALSRSQSFLFCCSQHL